MKRLILCLTVLVGCSSPQPVRHDRVFHTVMAYHPKAQAMVVHAQKEVEGALIGLKVDFNSVRPVLAHVYTGRCREGFELNQVLADSLETKKFPDGRKQVTFQQHMRDFPEGNFVVVELVSWVHGVPAPVACAWVIFVWDRIYLWDHQKALAPDGGGYLSGSGFYQLVDGAWEPKNPHEVSGGRLAIVQYQTR